MKTEETEVEKTTEIPFFKKMQFNAELLVLQGLYPSDETCSLILSGKERHGDLYVGRLPLIKSKAQGEINEGAIIYEKTQGKPLRLVIQALEDHELDPSVLLQNKKQLTAGDWELIDADIRVRQIPVMDRTVSVDFAVMQEIVEEINTTINSNNSVLIHCKAGHGRSVMIALCYLVARRNMNLSRAIDLIRSIRPNVAIDVRRECYVAQFIAIYYPERDFAVESAFPEQYSKIWESTQGISYNKASALLADYCEFSLWHLNRHHVDDVGLALKKCLSIDALLSYFDGLKKNPNGELARRLAFICKKTSQSLEMAVVDPDLTNKSP